MKIRERSVYFFLGAVLSLLMVDGSLNISRGDQTVQGEIKNITVTEKDNGSQFELKKGDVLTLRLESNPSTGYSWQIAGNDEKLMELMGKPTSETPERKLIVGGIEYEIFRFRALASGTNVLELCYKRIWEKEKEPLKTFRITAKIN
jgi:inhibitor of cysteine peptidase